MAKAVEVAGAPDTTPSTSVYAQTDRLNLPTHLKNEFLDPVKTGHREKTPTVPAGAVASDSVYDQIAENRSAPPIARGFLS